MSVNIDGESGANYRQYPSNVVRLCSDYRQYRRKYFLGGIRYKQYQSRNVEIGTKYKNQGGRTHDAGGSEDPLPAKAMQDGRNYEWAEDTHDDAT